MRTDATGSLARVPLRNLKAGLVRSESAGTTVQKLNSHAGQVLDVARGIVQLEPKQMAGEMKISHSLVLRGLKNGNLTFNKLWNLSDDFWAELLIAIARKRGIAAVKTTIEVNRRTA